MMNMQSRNQYLKELRQEYLKTKSKRQRGELLNEAEKRTDLNRKHLICKLKQISFRTIDEKLKHQKEIERQKRNIVKRLNCL